jgi:transcriptional regulator with XRE-family HTH domain
MPAAIESIIKQRVISQYLQGISRDRIATDNDIGTGTVSNIIDEWKKRTQDSDYESIRELSIFCKKQGITLNTLASCIRLNNYIQSLGTNASESTLESLIANLTNYPDRDPANLIEAAAQISESGIPLDKLEDHVKALMAEKEMLQRDIDEKRAILDGVDVDVESRRKIMEEYAQMRAEMRRYGIGPEDPSKIHACLQRFKDANYNTEEVIAGYANMEALRKERMELDEERLAFETRLATVKDVLPLAEQITRLKMGVDELLAFHSAVYEKADMERIPLDTAAYKIVEDIRDYSQLGLLKKEQDRLQQQIFMSNMIMASRQQALVSLIRLHSLGVSDMEIKNMAQLIDLNGLASSLKEAVGGNNNGQQHANYPV